jgi:hypothetical protein
MFNELSSGDPKEAFEKQNKEVFAQDIFDLGYILLISAVGGLDLLSAEVLDFLDTKNS